MRFCNLLLQICAVPTFHPSTVHVSVCSPPVDCSVSDLGLVVDIDKNERCNESFNGSVQIPAGLACYTGVAPDSLAEYICNCPQYGLEGSGTRVCQDDGTWTEAVPQCLPHCTLTILLHLYKFISQDILMCE